MAVDAQSLAGALQSAGIYALRAHIDSHFRDSCSPDAGDVLHIHRPEKDQFGLYDGRGLIYYFDIVDSCTAAVKTATVESVIAEGRSTQVWIGVCIGHHFPRGPLLEIFREKSRRKGFFSIGQTDGNDFLLSSMRRAAGLGQNLPRANALGVSELIDILGHQFGITKWLPWQAQKQLGRRALPDTPALMKTLELAPLTKTLICLLKRERDVATAYLDEIQTENIPKTLIEHVHTYLQFLTALLRRQEEYQIDAEEDEVEFCFDQLEQLANLNFDLNQLSQELKGNAKIRAVVEKLGKSPDARTNRRQHHSSAEMRSEVLGIHASGDLMRLLPSELLNLEDENLEQLFFSKYIENSLSTYELLGMDSREVVSEKKGPIIACVDSSGSMRGSASLKAQALLLAIADIIEDERRDLHILQFSSRNQHREKMFDKASQKAEILSFLSLPFNGETDFESALYRAIDLLEDTGSLQDADILMITDGLCKTSPEFNSELRASKSKLGCAIYTIICSNNYYISDGFSDEIINI